MERSSTESSYKLRFRNELQRYSHQQAYIAKSPGKAGRTCWRSPHQNPCLAAFPCFPVNQHGSKPINHQRPFRTRTNVSAPRDTVWLYYHISAILKTIKYCRERHETPHLFPGYSFGSILLEDFLPRASVLPAAPDDTGDPVPAYA